MRREIREGWLLLTAETKVNGDSKSTNERGPSLGCFIGLVVPVQEFFSCLGCSSRPSTKYFFLTIYYYNLYVPSPSKLGRQSCWLACLSICVSGHAQSQSHKNEKRFLKNPAIKSFRLPGLIQILMISKAPSTFVTCFENNTECVSTAVNIVSGPGYDHFYMASSAVQVQYSAVLNLKMGGERFD